MNREERRRARRLLGLHVEMTIYRCTDCGDNAVHVECWEGDDQPHGLPAELSRCECGGQYVKASRTQ
jgi:hypothetical protein